MTASLDMPGGAIARRIAHSDDVLWVAAGEAGLVAVDADPPDKPSVLGALALGADARTLAVQGDRAYVGAAAALEILDIGEPSAPAALGSTAPGFVVDGVAVAGDMVVVSSIGQGIRFVDVADSAAPQLRGALSGFASATWDVAFDGAHAYVATAQQGMAVVSAADPDAPELVATLGTGAFMLYDVARFEKLVFGADYFRQNSVPIVQVTMPQTPVFAGVVEFSQFGLATGESIAVDSQLVALGAGSRVYFGRWDALQDTGGTPPTCAFASPDAPHTFIQGQILTVEVFAVDDVATERVEIRFDGELVLDDSSPPFGVDLTLPLDLDDHEIGAVSVDLAGNATECIPIVASLIVDPLTTVVGLVVDGSGQPVAGAEVTHGTSGAVATTLADGTFQLAGAPSANPFTLTVAGDIGGFQYLDDFGPFEPEPEAVTDVGTLALVSVEGSSVLAGLTSRPVGFQTEIVDIGPFTTAAALASRPVGFTTDALDDSVLEPTAGALASRPVGFTTDALDDYLLEPTAGALTSPPIGFVSVPAITLVTPPQASIGAGGAQLMLSGFGLADATGVELFVAGAPSADITAGAPAPNPDGTLTVDITIDPAAQAGVYVVVATTPLGVSATDDFETNTLELID